MARYILIRFGQSIITLFILATVIFILARVIGNPVDIMLADDATPEQREHLIHELGLDRPLPIQYGEFLGNLLRGDLGESIKYDRPTIDLYLERLPNSLKLIAVGILFAIIFSVPLGVISGSRQGSWTDRFARVLAVIGIAAPSFWVGLVLIDIFAVRFSIFPVARMGGFDHYILPAFSMCFVTLAAMARLIRSSMIEVTDSEFAKLARIKGVSNARVTWWHCLRNSLIPAVSYLGTHIGLLFGGTIVIETVFAWPGCGRLAYDGILFRDYPLIQTVIIMHGAIIIFINLLTDILYSYIDPRIRYD